MALLDFGQVTGLLCAAIIVLAAIYIYFRGSIGRCNSKADLTGKTAIVTGANCGIGYYTALDFAKRNARVILACRNKERAEKAKDEITESTGNKNVIVRIVDLSRMKSVREFANQVNRQEEFLHILVNNAGILDAGRPKEMTEEGLETLYATNYFGPFLLTNLLLDLMKRSAPSRIVNVSSIVHKFGVIDFSNLNSEREFKHEKIYFNSKLALVLFTRELAKRLEGTGVTANVLHPGSVATELLNNMHFLIRFIVKGFVKMFCKTGEEGAETSIYLAVSDEVKDINGKYFADCDLQEKGALSASRDMELAAKLWDVSEKMTGMS